MSWCNQSSSVTANRVGKTFDGAAGADQKDGVPAGPRRMQGRHESLVKVTEGW